MEKRSRSECPSDQLELNCPIENVIAVELWPWLLPLETKCKPKVVSFSQVGLIDISREAT